MRARTIFIILLVLIILVAFGPALVAVISQTIAEWFGCQVDLNRVIPCMIGGKDYGDTFFYWFNRRTHTMDYLAYSEDGPRFRKAINSQIVGGIRFQDYINYKGDEKDTTSVGTYDRRYAAKQLPELSRIEQKNIQVTALP